MKKGIFENRAVIQCRFLIFRRVKINHILKVTELSKKYLYRLKKQLSFIKEKRNNPI